MLTEHIYVSFKMPWMEGLILDRFISALPCILDEFEFFFIRRLAKIMEISQKAGRIRGSSKVALLICTEALKVYHLQKGKKKI